jgi:hypothetical protein
MKNPQVGERARHYHGGMMLPGAHYDGTIKKTVGDMCEVEFDCDEGTVSFIHRTNLVRLVPKKKEPRREFWLHVMGKYCNEGHHYSLRFTPPLPTDNPNNWIHYREVRRK